MSLSVRFPVYQRIMVPSSSRDRSAWTFRWKHHNHSNVLNHSPIDMASHPLKPKSSVTSHQQYIQEAKSSFMNMCTAYMTQDFSFYYSHTRIISKIWRHSWQKTGLLQEVMEQHRQLRLFWYTFTVTLIFSEEGRWNCTTRVNVTWQNLVMNERCCKVSTHQLWQINRW